MHPLLERTYKSEENIVLTAPEVIEMLVGLQDNEEYQKRKPSPKFTIQEFRFIRDLIYRKPKGLLFHYLADHIMNDTGARYMPMFNAPSKRKLHFIHTFLSARSGAEAARRAGYSPKSAKQQAWRTLKEIHGHKRPK